MNLRATSRRPRRTQWRGLAIIVLLYALANAAIWIFADPEARLARAADGESWHRPALALLFHGGFVDLEDPDLVDTYRPPLYTIFQAAAMSVAGGPSAGAIVFAQSVLLLLVGLLFRNTVADWMPGWENFGMALLLFNPNILSTAQFVQSEILFLAFTTLALWSAARYVRRGGGWSAALIAGLAVALACLTRPTAQFLLIALPVLFPLLALFGNRLPMRRAIAQGTAALAVALVVVAPWVSLVASQGHGMALSDSAGKYRYVWDQITLIEAQAKGLSYHQASAALAAPGGAEHDFIARQGAAWKTLSRPERNRALADEGLRVLMSYPVADFAKALYRSQAQFFFAGGAGNWHNLFGVGADTVSAAWFSGAQDDLWTLLKKLLSDIPPAGLIFSAAAIGFTMAGRLLGLIGLFAFLGRARRVLLLILLGLIAYFAFVHVFVGNSRYRIAVEPTLTLLMLGGLEQIGRMLRRG